MYVGGGGGGGGGGYGYVYKQGHMFVGVGWHMFVLLLKGEYVCVYVEWGNMHMWRGRRYVCM